MCAFKRLSLGKVVSILGWILVTGCGAPVARDEPGAADAKRQVNKLVQGIVTRDPLALEQADSVGELGIESRVWSRSRVAK